MNDVSYDLIILGGGPAGYTAALRAKNGGAKVCLIEMKDLGGTCLNRGCIPTKCFCHSTRHYAKLKMGVLPEIKFEKLTLDYPAMLARKNGVVSGLREGLATLLAKAGVRVLKGKGRIGAKGEVEIFEGEGKGEKFPSKMILVCTGSSPASLPFLPDDARIYTTDSIWDLAQPPERLLIIGGGVIGVEAATIYSQVSKEVTIVELLPDILSNVSRSVRRIVAKSLAERGVKIITGKKVSSVKASKYLEVLCEGDSAPANYDAILVAVGRRPNVEGVFAGELGIELNGGAVKVDDGMQTSRKGLYAAGDIIGNPMLAHAAAREAIVAINRGLGFDPKDRVDFDLIPEAIFSDPEIAKVGTVPDATAKREASIKTGRFPYIASSKAMCEGETEGFAEVAYDEAKKKITGGVIVGANASDLIGELIAAINGNLSAETIEKSVHPHPTLTEIVWEACADSVGKAIYKIRKK